MTTSPDPHPFFCVWCGYDLTPLRACTGEPIACPECARTTDPYSPRAVRIRRRDVTASFLTVFAASLAPGLAIGFALVGAIPLLLFVGPTILVPAAIAQRLLDRAPGDQRRRLSRALGAAIGLGVLLGVVVWPLIALA